MSLLINYNHPKLLEIAQKIYKEQFKRDPKLERELDEGQQRMMYQDIIYNINYLMTAVDLKDKVIFIDYALWLYELLCNLMQKVDRDRIMIYMTDHYKIMIEIMEDDSYELLNKEDSTTAVHYLHQAIVATEDAVMNIPLTKSFLEGEYKEIRIAYLDALMNSQTQKAHKIIRGAKEANIPLEDIYEEILTKVMYEIGELWYQNIITVGKEHYATSVTQTVMAQFYEEVFSTPRKNRSLLSCGVGSELHEIGIRMISDIFEYHGWDTYYLGAAMPEGALMKAIEEQKPEVIILSVTISTYLPVCKEIVKKIRWLYPSIKIAIGGQAFKKTNELWKKWDIDYYSTSLKEFIQWAEDI